MAEARKPRSSFGPVVLVGLAAGAFAAVAGSKPWVSGRSGDIDTSADSTSAMASILNIDGARESPLAAALALAVLACWGVLLVTRGLFRKAIAVLALVAAVGLVVTTVEGFWSLPSKLNDALLEASGTDTASTSFTGWYAAALVGAVLSVLATLAAVLRVRSWPEMGTKYDAPGAAPAGGEATAPTDNIDIWKALDEGRDPTA
jgi:uncharacterized membrane protein (TIGR02234 family)